MLKRFQSGFSVDEISRILCHQPLFSALSPAGLERLAQASRRSDCHKNQLLEHAGQTHGTLYLVISGLLKRTAVSIDGQEKVIELAGSGEWCGLGELFSDGLAQTHLVAVESGTLLEIEGAAMREAMTHEPALAVRLVRELANNLAAVENELVALQSSSMNDRVLTFLLSLTGPNASLDSDRRGDLPASKQLVASRLGITPESLSRALRELADAGVILNQGRSFIIRNAALAHYAKSRQAMPASPAAKGRQGPYPVQREQVEAADAPVSLTSLVNIAGRQRMLTERSAKAWLMWGQGLAPVRARSMLRQSIAQFDSQAELLAAVPVRHHISESMQVVSGAWNAYRELLQEPPCKEGLLPLISASDAVVAALDRLIQRFVTRSDGATCGLINRAGRQRMLMQRLAKMYLCWQWGLDEAVCVEALAADRAEFEGVLVEVREFGAVSPLLRRQLIQAEKQAKVLLEALDASLHTRQAHAGHEISLVSERVVRELDIAVSLIVDHMASSDPWSGNGGCPRMSVA